MRCVVGNEIVALRKESVDRNITSSCTLAIDSVALRKESVDRNGDPKTEVQKLLQSLSARRAWIEIEFHGLLYPVPASLSARRAWIEIMFLSVSSASGWVALRKESVDRNRISWATLPCSCCRSPQGERG